MNVVDYSIHFPRNTINRPTVQDCIQKLTNKLYVVVVEENGLWTNTRYI